MDFSNTIFCLGRDDERYELWSDAEDQLRSRYEDAHMRASAWECDPLVERNRGASKCLTLGRTDADPGWYVAYDDSEDGWDRDNAAYSDEASALAAAHALVVLGYQNVRVLGWRESATRETDSGECVPCEWRRVAEEVTL